MGVQSCFNIYLLFLENNENIGKIYLCYYHLGDNCNCYLTNDDCSITYQSTLSLVEKVKVYSEFALKSDINKLTTIDKHISFERASNITYYTNDYVNVGDDKETAFDFEFIENVSSSTNTAHRGLIADSLNVMQFIYNKANNNYTLSIFEGSNTISSLTIESLTYKVNDELAQKSDIPTDYINSSSLTNKLNEYSTTTVCDKKYLKKTGNISIDGSLNINPTSNISMTIYNPNLGSCQIRFGNGSDGYKCRILQFYHYTDNENRVSLGMHGNDHVITFNQSMIYLTKSTTINDNLTVNNIDLLAKISALEAHIAVLEKA